MTQLAVEHTMILVGVIAVLFGAVGVLYSFGMEERERDDFDAWS